MRILFFVEEEGKLQKMMLTSDFVEQGCPCWRLVSECMGKLLLLMGLWLRFCNSVLVSLKEVSNHGHLFLFPLHLFLLTYLQMGV